MYHKHPWSPYQIFKWERYGENGVTIFSGYGIMDVSGKIIAECTSYNSAVIVANALKANQKVDSNSRH